MGHNKGKHIFFSNIYWIVSHTSLVYPTQIYLRFLTQRNSKNAQCNKALGIFAIRCIRFTIYENKELGLCLCT